MKKLKIIYQETLFLTWLGMTAEEVSQTLQQKNVGTIKRRNEVLRAKFLHPDEPQTMMRVIAKAELMGIMPLLRKKFATRFATQIKQAAKLPQELEGLEVEE